MNNGIISKRMSELISLASDCFENGYSPFETEWLAEHAVTLDECMQLSSLIGTILSGFCSSRNNVQKEILVNAALVSAISK